MKPRKRVDFDVESFLKSVGMIAKTRDFRQNEVIFSQGDPVTNVLYFIRKGSVKRSVLSPSGKERIVSILGRGDFLGAWCLFDHPVRPATTSAILPTSVLVITKKNMIRALHEHDLFSDRFIAYVLARWIRLEGDLINQLFNSSEKRLARLLLQLSQNGRTRNSETVMPNVSQQLLAEMIGTSRQQVNGLMNKFRRLGFIDYNSNGGLKIHDSLSRVTLWD
ncbi:MAG: Crp/Fnr family transcriptional regulator [Candidatus Acidiferrales bacterium]|jgi:CRP-like cAMP-binding protein